jgi:hypothetical protein
MTFLVDRIGQLEARCRTGLDGGQPRNTTLQKLDEPLTVELQVLQAANAVVEAQAEWLLQKLRSDLAHVRSEFGSIDEVGRCAGRVAAFMQSPRNFESSEFSSILECADRIFAGLDFEPSRKYSEAFRSLRCKVIEELRQIYTRHNLNFTLERLEFTPGSQVPEHQ